MFVKIVKRAVGLAAVLATTTGCISVPKLVAPVGVGPLPYDWRLAESGADSSAKIAPQLCRMKKGWLFGRRYASDVCYGITGLDVRGRNELQHMLMGSATQACHEFKRKLYSMTKGGMVFGAVSQLSSAASGLLGGGKDPAIAAAAGTVAGGIGADFDGYFRETKLAIALSGVELARTRIFKQVKDQEGKSVEEYPVARAVNDAFRYHNVCTLAEGLSESAGAVEAATEKVNRPAENQPSDSGEGEEQEEDADALEQTP